MCPLSLPTSDEHSGPFFEEVEMVCVISRSLLEDACVI